MGPTDTEQDYLKAIYSLSESGARITTSAIASRLGVSSASVTSMIKKLSDRGHLRYRRYRGVELTASGRAAALEVIRHHRLIEQYLHEGLGLAWDKVHAEAEILEHALSEELEDVIAARLGHPTHDPHGDPIPPKRGKHVDVHHFPLDTMDAGSARVERVSDRDSGVLRYLGDLGLRPGADITVEKQDKLGGLTWLRIGRKRHAIGSQLAGSIFVSRRST